MWVLATVLAQRRDRLATAVRRLDPLGLVPAWTFFAPNPGTTDHMVLVRDRVGGDWGPWRIAWREPRYRARPIWRPGRRTSKLVTDSLAMWSERHRTAPDGAEASVAFLLLAAIAERAPHAPGATNYQFAVIDVAEMHATRPSVVQVLGSPELLLPATGRRLPALDGGERWT